MTDMKHLLRLKAQGRSNREIARMLGLHRNTVNSYIQLFNDSGQSTEALLSLSEADLLRLVEPPPASVPERQASLLALLPKIEGELRKTGGTLLNVWEHLYRPQGGTYSYAQFGRLVRLEMKKKSVGLRWEHRLGDKVFVDFSGKKLPVTDPQTGQVSWKEVFVAVLGASQYTYAEAMDDQSLENFLLGVQNALHYFGGVPRAIVPNNLKSAVTKADRYEPEVNRNFEAMGQHYGTVVLPTRAVRPGVLGLKKAFPADRIEAACRRARLFENFHYTTVRNILQKGLDALDPLGTAHSDSGLPQLHENHPNIRGADYFA